MFEGGLGGHYNARRSKVVVVLFLILYHTPYSTKLKINKTNVVTVCLFRIFPIKKIILNPVTVAKHLIVWTVLEYSCVVIFAKKLLITTNNFSGPLCWNSDRSLFQHCGPISCQFTHYAKLRPLAVCIHKEGSNLYKV